MTRAAAISLATFVVAIAGQVKAEHHHKAWWQYMKGEWSYAIEELNEKGTATWRVAAKGNAIVGRFRTDDGGVEVELGGWCAGSKAWVINGYGSGGNSWRIELTKITETTTEGPHSGVLPDGQTYKGTFKVNGRLEIGYVSTRPPQTRGPSRREIRSRSISPFAGRQIVRSW